MLPIGRPPLPRPPPLPHNPAIDGFRVPDPPRVEAQGKLSTSSVSNPYFRAGLPVLPEDHVGMGLILVGVVVCSVLK